MSDTKPKITKAHRAALDTLEAKRRSLLAAWPTMDVVERCLRAHEYVLTLPPVIEQARQDIETALELAD